MVYGMLCTFMSFGIVFFIIYESSNLGWLLDLSSGTPFQLSKGEAALVAAIFSATDSVSALSIINPKKFPTLYSILAGEGIINDGMAIVIFKIVEYVNESGAETNAAGFIILEFLQLTLGSAAVGILLGLSHAILVKYQSHEPHPIRNVCLLCFFAYISYELAQVIYCQFILEF
jgi:sodium/hydrogen exchanger-like protein 6/7